MALPFPGFWSRHRFGFFVFSLEVSRESLVVAAKLRASYAELLQKSQANEQTPCFATRDSTGRGTNLELLRGPFDGVNLGVNLRVNSFLLMDPLRVFPLHTLVTGLFRKCASTTPCLLEGFHFDS